MYFHRIFFHSFYALMKYEKIFNIPYFFEKLDSIFIPNLNFKKESYRIIPETVLSFIFYYLFLLVCIINTFTNFFCFSWRIFFLMSFLS